jgi:hypothetical protein
MIFVFSLYFCLVFRLYYSDIELGGDPRGILPILKKSRSRATLRSRLERCNTGKNLPEADAGSGKAYAFRVDRLQ